MEIKILDHAHIVFDVYCKVKMRKLVSDYVIIGTNMDCEDIVLKTFDNEESAKSAMAWIAQRYGDNHDCVLIL